MQEPVNNNRSELWTLSFRDLFYKYVRFLPVFLLSVSLCLFIAYAYLRYATRIYSATSTLLIKGEEQQGRSDKFEDVFMNNKALNIASEIEILRSRPLMERVVRRLNLEASYIAKGNVITANVYKQGPFLLQIFELNDSMSSFSLALKFVNERQFRINNDKNIFSFDEVFKSPNGVFRIIKNGAQVSPKGSYVINWQPAPSVAASLAGGVQVTPKTLGTGILSITIQGDNPQMCTDIVNQLMLEYIANGIEQKNKTSDQILAFIDDRLNVYGHTLDSVQKKLLDFEQKNNLIDVDAQTGNYFSNISESDKATYEQTMKANVTDMVDQYLSDKKNQFDKVVVPSSLGLEDLTLNGLVGEYNKAQIDRRALLDANVPADNPAVQQINGQIEQLRVSIRENLRNIKSSLNAVISHLRSESGENEAQLRALPVKVKELAEIKRQAEALEKLYQYLQEKKEETAITRASNIPTAQVVDNAGVSTVPIKPKKKAILILAIILGVSLPAMFIFISEVLNDKITTRFDIEKITPAPILGEIGHSYSSNSLIVTKTTRSMVAEQFRIIRSNLQYILNKAEKSTILVTSSFSGEGKSFVTTNMGAVLGLAGKKTIILEFDIRKPRILSGLNMPKRPGITNYLVGKAGIDELIAPVPEHENLFVMACGPIPPNPSELLLDQRVSELFADLRTRFDIILVDTAPVGMVSDAQTLSKFADCTLYLVRQGHTFKKQVALIDEFYQENKLPKVSIVINDVKVKPGYGYYGYGRYGYGYGYGYGSYYEEDTPPPSFLEKTLGWLDPRRFFRKSRKG